MDFSIPSIPQRARVYHALNTERRNNLRRAGISFYENNQKRAQGSADVSQGSGPPPGILQGRRSGGSHNYYYLNQTSLPMALEYTGGRPSALCLHATSSGHLAKTCGLYVGTRLGGPLDARAANWFGAISLYAGPSPFRIVCGTRTSRVLVCLRRDAPGLRINRHVLVSVWVSYPSMPSCLS